MKLTYIGITGALALALAVSLPAFAASSFVVTGIIDESLTTKVANVTATKVWADEDLVEETLHENVPYSFTSSTKFYKYANKKLTKTNAKALKMGQEVVVKGTKSGNTFKVSSITINDRTFTITGHVSDVDKSKNTIKVGVKTSSYKQASIKGTDVIMHYNSKTVCMESGKEIGCSEIDSDGQKITVMGGVTGTENSYDLTKVINKK